MRWGNRPLQEPSAAARTPREPDREPPTGITTKSNTRKGARDARACGGDTDTGAGRPTNDGTEDHSTRNGAEIEATDLKTALRTDDILEPHGGTYGATADVKLPASANEQWAQSAGWSSIILDQANDFAPPTAPEHHTKSSQYTGDSIALQTMQSSQIPNSHYYNERYVSAYARVRVIRSPLQ